MPMPCTRYLPSRSWYPSPCLSDVIIHHGPFHTPLHSPTLVLLLLLLLLLLVLLLLLLLTKKYIAWFQAPPPWLRTVTLSGASSEVTEEMSPGGRLIGCRRHGVMHACMHAVLCCAVLCGAELCCAFLRRHAACSCFFGSPTCEVLA
jgi:hypothetical protein